MDVTNPAPERPPFQYSLRTLLIVVTLVAIVCALVSWRVSIVHQRKVAVESVRDEVQALDGDFNKGLVDGTFYVGLEERDVNDTILTDLAAHFRRFPGPYLDQSHDLNLHLSGNPITDAGLSTLAGLNVTVLDVSGTEISDEGVATITTFKHLRRLNITDTQVTESGLGQIRSALPRCELTE